MNNQSYDIYDIITGQKINIEQVKQGKSYIIYYPYEKWKVRTVKFDENKNIINEQFINREDRDINVENTLVEILERQGNTNINIEYRQGIDLESGENPLQMKLPVYYVTYTNIDGIEKERIVESQSLQEILVTKGNGNKEIHIQDSIIKSVQIGRNNQTNRQNNSYGENQKYFNENEKNTSNEKTSKATMQIYMNNVNLKGDTTVSKGNIIIHHTNKDGKQLDYDLRTDEGVEQFRTYIENQKEDLEEMSRNP